MSETVSAGVWDFLNDAVKFLNRIHTYLRLHRSQGVFAISLKFSQIST